MDASTDSIFVGLPWSETLLRLRRVLDRVGLRLLETFDLQAARSASADCTCPRHGTADCDCQMLVLMVYHEGTAPATLMLHGSDGQTWISVAEGASAQDVDPLGAAIEQALWDIRTE